MEKLETKAIFYSNKNIELAYTLKKVCRELGIYVTNCDTSTDLIMENYLLQPEIIFFDLTTNNISAEFIETFSKKGFYYTPNIILIGHSEISINNNESFIIFLNEHSIEIGLKEKINDIKFSSTKNKMQKYSDYQIGKAIIDSFKPLTFKKSHKGYKYLKDIISFICKNNGDLFSLTKTIYPNIAVLNKVSAGSVERNIRTAIKHCWQHSKHSEIESYFGELKKAPSNLQVIVALVEKTFNFCLSSNINENII